MDDTSISRLTDHDRRIIDRARALAGAFTVDSMRPLVGQPAGAEGELVRTEALGVAQYLLAELADLAERLGGGPPEADRYCATHGRAHWNDNDRTCRWTDPADD